MVLAVEDLAFNDSSDLPGEISNALLLQQVSYCAAILTVQDVFRIAIDNGAKLLGFDKIGKLKEGLAADLAILNLARLEYVGSLSDSPAALIFTVYNHGTEQTIVDGHTAVREGRFTGYDENAILQKPDAIAKRLLNQP